MAQLVRKAEIAVGRFLSARLPFLYAALRFCYQAPFILGCKFRKNIFVRYALLPSGKGEHLFGYHDKPLVCFDAALEGNRQVSVADNPPAAGDTGGSPRDTPARVPDPDALFAAEGRTA